MFAEYVEWPTVFTQQSRDRNFQPAEGEGAEGEVLAEGAEGVAPAADAAAAPAQWTLCNDFITFVSIIIIIIVWVRGLKLF